LRLLPHRWDRQTANGYLIPIPMASAPTSHHVVIPRLKSMDVFSPINGKTLVLATSLIATNGHQTSITSSLNILSSSYQDKFSIRNDLDQVERVLDGNTVQLKKNGIVRLAGIQMPSSTCSNFKFPSCFSYSPSYKLRQLLPKATRVQVETVRSPSATSSSSAAGSGSTKPPQVVLVRKDDGLVVNQQLVKTGFAKVLKPKSNPEIIGSSSLLNFDLLSSLEENARSVGLGMYTKCEPMQQPTTERDEGL
jgi:endonuclease YncB( thermonuclease family)